jgi:hypothetical protein
MLGFVSRNGVASVDDVTIRSRNRNTLAFDVVDMFDDLMEDVQ